MKFVNLTPHAIMIVVGDRSVEVPPSGSMARVSMTSHSLGEVVVGGVSIPVSYLQPGPVEGLPDPENETIFLVSALVIGHDQVQARTDVLAPDTGTGALRDPQGRIIGTKGLIAPRPGR